MRNLEVALKLSLTGQQAVIAGFRQSQQAVNSFAAGTQRAMNNAVQAVRRLNNELNGFSSVSKLAATLGGMSVARNALTANLAYHRDLLEMKQTGEMSVADSATAKKLSLQVASDTLQLPDDVLRGMRAYTTAGEKFEFMMASISESARAATAYFTSAEDVAKLDVDARQKLGIQPEQQKDMHNMLLYHGRAGRYEIGPMSRDAPKTFNTMAGAGFTGLQAVNLTGALTQQLMKLAPATQPAEVATFMEHFFGHLTQKHYVKGLAKKGINIKKFMPGGYFGGVDENGKPIGGDAAVKDLMAFLRALKAKNLDDPFKLSEAGFREMYTMKAAKQLLTNVDALEEEMRKGDVAAKQDLVGDALKEIKEANFGKVKAAEIEVAKMKLTDQATGMTGQVANLAKWAGENPGSAIGGALALLIGGRWGLRKGLPRMFGQMEGAAASGEAALARGSMNSVVTAANARPAAHYNAAGQALNKAEIEAWEQAQARMAKEAGQAKWGKLVGRSAGPLLSGVFAGIEVGEISRNHRLSDYQKKVAYSGVAGDVLGSTGGASLGAAIGGAIGTAILPGVGTAIGALLGGLAGALGGGKVGRKAGEKAAEAALTDSGVSLGVMEGYGMRKRSPKSPSISKNEMQRWQDEAALANGSYIPPEEEKPEADISLPRGVLPKHLTGSQRDFKHHINTMFDKDIPKSAPAKEQEKLNPILEKLAAALKVNVAIELKNPDLLSAYVNQANNTAARRE